MLCRSPTLRAVHALTRPLARVIHSFSPASLPLLARRSYWLELITTLFFSITLAAVEGGVMGVFTKQSFAGVVGEGRLNAMVALVGAAPEIANILSFIWASFSHGRAKIPFVNALQLAVILLVAGIALVPRSPAGLVGLGVLVIASRVCWSGIITLRPTIWRVNYPPRVRARIVGKFATIQQVTVAGVGLLMGALLDWRESTAAVVIPLGAAALGLVALLATSRQRVRTQRAMLSGERTEPELGRPWHGLLSLWTVLRRDARYAQYMVCMFVLGFGNLMITPMLVILFRDEFHRGHFASILVITAIPYLLLPLAIPLWARLLDRAHVVRFRSIHAWSFVISTSVFLLAVVLHSMPVMILGSLLQGIAVGGGSLAWNLGHVDFAPPARTSQYMAAHVTLNGIRGLLAPLVAVAMYESLLRSGLDAGTAGAWTLGLSAALAALGSVGFVALRISMGHHAAARRS